MDTERKPQLTTLLLLLILAAGCSLRLIGLGSSSLTENEAENALTALRLFDGESTRQLLYALPTALLFRMFGDSEFTARLVPALSGIVLSLLPLSLIKRFGRKRMLLLSLILALDPVLLFWSKRADAVVPVIMMTAGVLVCLIHEKPAAALCCFLIALCGGERCLPALICLILAGVEYGLIGKVDLVREASCFPIRKRGLAAAAAVFLLFVTAFTTFPAGISSFCTGIVNGLKPASQWMYLNHAAIVIALIVYCGIPLLLFLYGCIKSRKAALGFAVLWGSFLLLLGQGVLALPWISCILWCTSINLVTEIVERLKGRINFVFCASAGITVGAFSFFYFRLVEMFDQQNGAEPVQINWNGTLQTLPLTRTGASLILTAVSILIIGLIVKILLGFFDSDTVRRGLLCGCLIICTWGLGTNIWNTSGFDRIGDHPAAAHLENSRSLLNGNYTAFTESPLFTFIEEIRAKHGDTSTESFGVNFITDDPLLDWQLRKLSGIRRTANLQEDVSGVDMILSRTDSSFTGQGFVGTVIQYRQWIRWDLFSFTDWGRWLLFGDGTASDRTALTLWVRGDMIYSAEE